MRLRLGDQGLHLGEVWGRISDLPHRMRSMGGGSGGEPQPKASGGPSGGEPQMSGGSGPNEETQVPYGGGRGNEP